MCSHTYACHVFRDLTIYECDVNHFHNITRLWSHRHAHETAQRSLFRFRSLCCIACYNMNGCCCILMLFLNSIVFRRAFFPSHTPLLYLKVCLPDAEMQQQARNRKGRHSAERAAFQHPARLHLRPHTNSCVSRTAKSKDPSAHQTTLKADHCTKHVI